MPRLHWRQHVSHRRPEHVHASVDMAPEPEVAWDDQSAHLKDDLAAGMAGLTDLVGTAGLGQRQDGVHDASELPRIDQRRDLLQLGQLGFEKDVRLSHAVRGRLHHAGDARPQDQRQTVRESVSRKSLADRPIPRIQNLKIVGLNWTNGASGGERQMPLEDSDGRFVRRKPVRRTACDRAASAGHPPCGCPRTSPPSDRTSASAQADRCSWTDQGPVCLSRSP